MYTEELFINDLRDPKKAAFRSSNTAKFFVEKELTNINQAKELLLLTGKTGSKEALVYMYRAIGMSLPKDLYPTAFKMNIVATSSENIESQQDFLACISERKFMLKNKKPQHMLKPLTE